MEPVPEGPPEDEPELPTSGPPLDVESRLFGDDELEEEVDVELSEEPDGRLGPVIR